MTSPVPLDDAVRAQARRLEAERLRPAPALTPQQQVDHDLRQVIAILATALLGPAGNQARLCY